MQGADHLLMPWFGHVREHAGGFDLFDAHTHIGANDPDGFRQTTEELLERLGRADARGVVFPMHEPGGYTAANEAVLEAAAASNGRLVAFCRVDPHRAALQEAARCLDAGARGIKLHPRAERFDMAAPAVHDLVALAHERRVPVLVHAGRGIPALGRKTVELAEAHPDARLILAHAAVSDLAWLWRALPAHPNVYVDTAWWSPTDLLALFRLAPPGQVLWASDLPYGTAVHAATVTVRCALQAGLTPEQVRVVAGGQLERLLAGEDPVDLGPGPRDPAQPVDLLLERVADYLNGAVARRLEGGDGEEPIALARLACAVGEDAPQAGICASVLALLDRAAAHAALPEHERLPLSDLHVLVLAMTLARTPDVPVPHVPDEPEPDREAIDA